MVITACRLASSVRHPDAAPPKIPIFDFWVTSLCRALREDTFYDRDSWKTFGDRATSLENGIYAMAQQCCELERMPNPASGESDSTPPASPTASRRPKRLGTYRNINGKMTVVSEEDMWMQKIVLGCWTTLLADAKRQRSLGTAEKKDVDGPSRPLSAFRSPSL